MSNQTSTSRREIRERARKRKQRKKLIPILAMSVIGVVLIGLSLFLVFNRPTVQAAVDYNPEEVSHQKPLYAIHEMEPFDPDSVPFLPEDRPQPAISIPKSFHDFGSVGPNEVVKQEFVIVNEGEAPLTISRAYTTCGCTTANFTGTVIPPGDVSVLTLRFDAGYHDTRGQTVRRGVVIENNDPNNPQMEVWAEASVRSN